MCTVVAKPHPFRTDRIEAKVQQGQTIAEMLGDAAHSCRVSLGGVTVAREWWDKVRPKAGQTLHVEVFPQGGESGDKWLRAVLMVVLIYFTAGAGATWAGGISAATGISTGVIYAVAGLLGSLEGRPLLPEATA